MRERGFLPLGSRTFVRVNDCIVQELDVQLTAYGGGDFCVNYATDTLCFPFEAFTRNWGDRLRHPGGGEKWWPAGTHHEADRSMVDVVAAFDRGARQDLNNTLSPESFVIMLREKVREHDHHSHLQLGATNAWLNERDAAIASLENAILWYDRDLVESRALGYGREWAIGYQTKARELVAAVRAGTHRELLGAWISWRSTLLKLHKIKS